MAVSKETQELILASFIQKPYLFSNCKEQMSDSFFSDLSCKVIYKALTVYYNKYNSIPNINELSITSENCWYPTLGVSLDDVKFTCNKLSNIQEVGDSFILDKIQDFIVRNKSSVVLKDFVEKVRDNEELDAVEVVKQLASATDVNISSTKVFDMSDIEQLREARMSAVGNEDVSKVIPTCFPTLNSNLMFKGWQPSTINMVVSPPGTGKSMFLVNEGVHASKLGYNVLHIFIGDMVEYDGFIRYLSCVSGTPQNTLVMMNLEKQQELVKICNQQYDDVLNRIRLLSYPSMSITVDTLMEDVFKFEKQLGTDFDMIIVDYPDNLIQDGRSLYEDGGVLYSCLEKFARVSQAVVLVASQPKQTYWQHEILPLESAAESSKKQQCVDIVLGMNTSSRGSEVGTFHLAKARKGQVGKIFRFKTDFTRCHIEETTEEEYQACRNASGI